MVTSDYREVAPPPTPPLARGRLFALAFEVDGVDVITTRSRRMYVSRGLLGLFVLPVLFAILVVLVAVLFALQGAEVREETLITIWALLSAAGAVWGLALLVLSRPLSRRGSIRFDRARNVVRVDGREEPFAGLEVHVRALGGFASWTALELRRGDVTVATINDRMQSVHGDDISAHAHYLATLLGAPPTSAAMAAVTTKKHLIDDNTAAMLCYLPLQGIHVIASLYYLFAARDRPFVRFAAKQSLLQVAFTFAALLVFGAGFGVPLAMVAQNEHELSAASITLIVLLAVSLCAVAIGNIVAHLVACSRAHRGVAWVIPWLRPISAKWLPPSP